MEMVDRKLSPLLVTIDMYIFLLCFGQIAYSDIDLPVLYVASSVRLSEVRVEEQSDKLMSLILLDFITYVV